MTRLIKRSQRDRSRIPRHLRRPSAIAKAEYARRSAYHERNDWFFGARPSGQVCLECRSYTHRYTCCGKGTYTLGHVLRVPPRRASRAKWKAFTALLWQWTDNLRVRRENACRQ